MIEFDLELARLAIAAGSGKIVTRDGHNVNLDNLFSVDPDDFHYFPLTGLICLQQWETGCWTLEGKYTRAGIFADYDLFIEEIE